MPRRSATTPVPIPTGSRAVPVSASDGRTLTRTNMYECTQCGKVLPPKDNFVKTKGSDLYKARRNYAPICNECLARYMSVVLEQTKSHIVAIEAMCAVVDIPFIRDLATEYIGFDEAEIIQKYPKRLADVSKPRGKGYAGSLWDRAEKTGALYKEQVKGTEQGWDEHTRFNKDYVIDIVGYDPFRDPALSDESRKYLFNTMAGYCPDSSVSADSHKVQSIINIVLAQHQVHCIDEAMNQELAKSAANIDDQLLSKYASVKKQLLAAIDDLADKNKISAKYNDKSKGSNTLTNKMRDIEQDGYKNILVNYFDISTAKAIRQMAEISMQAAFKELEFQDNDYTDMLTEQRRLIEEQEDTNARLREENRILNNRILELEGADGN